MAYVHEGYKARNEGRSFISGHKDLSYVPKRDIIYANKSKKQGLKELKETIYTGQKI